MDKGKKYREKLREDLKKYRGGTVEVMKKTGLSRQSIYDVLKGKWYNYQVLKATAEVIAAREAILVEERKEILRDMKKAERLAEVATRVA